MPRPLGFAHVSLASSPAHRTDRTPAIIKITRSPRARNLAKAVGPILRILPASQAFFVRHLHFKKLC